MRHFKVFQVIFAATLILLSNMVHAEDSTATAGKALRELHSLGLGLQKTIMLYFMLQGEEGDPRIGTQVDQSAKLTDLTWQSLKRSLTQLGLTSSAQAIDQAITAFEADLNACRTAISKNGFAEPAVTAQMKDKEASLQQLLINAAQKTKESTQYKISSNVVSLRALALLMQQMTARYVERASSTMGNAYQDKSSDTELDQLAQYFRKKLEEVQAATNTDNAVRGKLKNVSVRWNFMEGSFIHYNEDSVPFLVARYSDEIIQQLNDAAQLLDK